MVCLYYFSFTYYLYHIINSIYLGDNKCVDVDDLLRRNQVDDDYFPSQESNKIKSKEKERYVIVEDIDIESVELGNKEKEQQREKDTDEVNGDQIGKN